VIDSWDCCYHFLLVEVVRRHLSRGHDPVLSVLVSRETGVRLQSPSFCRPSNPLPYCARSNVWSFTIREGVRGAAEDVDVLRARAAGSGARTPFDVNKCCFKLQLATCKMLIIISSLLHRLHPLCWRSLFCTAAVQVFSPVSLVFALHMIKTGNYKNRTGTAVVIKIPTETDRTSENGNRHSTSAEMSWVRSVRTPHDVVFTFCCCKVRGFFWFFVLYLRITWKVCKVYAV